MKSNVDLTENQIFTPFEESNEILKLIFDVLKVTKPWDFKHYPEKFNCDEEISLFPVGYKKDIQIWKKKNLFNTGQICVFCGKNINNKPWGCDCYSTKYKSSIPWEF